MTSLVCALIWLFSLHTSTGSRMGPTTPRPSDFAQCRLSDDLGEQFVDFHNKFRGEVQPSAADMEYLVSCATLPFFSVDRVLFISRWLIFEWKSIFLTQVSCEKWLSHVMQRNSAQIQRLGCLWFWRQNVSYHTVFSQLNAPAFISNFAWCTRRLFKTGV